MKHDSLACSGGAAAHRGGDASRRASCEAGRRDVAPQRAAREHPQSAVPHTSVDFLATGGMKALPLEHPLGSHSLSTFFIFVGWEGVLTRTNSGLSGESRNQLFTATALVAPVPRVQRPSNTLAARYFWAPVPRSPPARLLPRDRPWPGCLTTTHAVRFKKINRSEVADCSAHGST